jgi:ABC-type phosphate transport system permease subunit
MDALSKLYGWLTGTWRNQNSIGKAILGCAMLLLMACVCGVPLILLTFFES